MAGPAAIALKNLRERAGLSVAVVAKDLGMPKSTYAAYEDKYKRATLPIGLTRKLVQILSGLGTPPVTDTDVLRLGGVPEMGRDSADRPQSQGMVGIHEYDVRAGSGPEQIIDQDQGVETIHEWRLPAALLRGQTTAHADNLKIITIYGDSMEPELPPGTRVIVDTSDRSPTPPGIFAVFDGLGLVVKRVHFVPFSDPPIVRLSSDNDRYPVYERTLDEAHVQGRVIGQWKWR